MSEHPFLTRRSLLRGGLAAGAAFAVGGPLLAACGDDSSSTSSSDASVASGLSEPSTKPDKLIVRSWADPWSTAIGDGPGASFTEKTGIPIEFDTTEFQEMDTKVREAVQSGERPPVDVVYTLNRSAYTATVQDVAVPMDTGVVTNFGQLLDVGKPVGGEGTGYVTIYTYTLPLFYRSENITFEQGDSWEVMFSDELEGRLFVPSNFDPLLFPIAKMLDLDVATDDLGPVWDKLEELRPLISVIGDDTPFIEGMISGEVWSGSALVGDAFAMEGVDVGWIVPTEGAVLTGDAMYVPAGLPDDVSYYAQVFINEVIDAQLQTEWCAAVSTVPTNEGASVAPELEGDPAFPFTQDEIDEFAIPMPDDLAARNADEWQERYTAAIQG